jgi:hypothetical protein
MKIWALFWAVDRGGSNKYGNSMGSAGEKDRG